MLFYNAEIDQKLDADEWQEWGGRLKTSTYREYKSHGPGVNGGHRIGSKPAVEQGRGTQTKTCCFTGRRRSLHPSAAVHDMWKLSIFRLSNSNGKSAAMAAFFHSPILRQAERLLAGENEPVFGT